MRGEVRPWAMQEPQSIEGTPIRVFFSPSCSACRQLVTGISVADSRKIIWCPVAEEENDLAVILNLQQRLAVSGAALSTQFVPALETQPLSALDCCARPYCFCSPAVVQSGPCAGIRRRSASACGIHGGAFRLDP